MRTDYNKIAHLYDKQPYRNKGVDPHLVRFIDDHPEFNESDLSILDMGCGTGNQLIADHEKYPDVQMVGLDLFKGMLDIARQKCDQITWMQGDSANPDLPDESFHFITNQFSYHHVKDKESFASSVYRLLKPGGRFVLTNICPHKMQDNVLYEYFPEALEHDLRDMLAPDTLKILFEKSGFNKVTADINDTYYEISISDYLDYVKHRDYTSQFMVISDEEYKEGLGRIEDQIKLNSLTISLNMHNALITIIAEKVL